MRGSLLRRVRHWVANRGWKGFLAEVMRRARLLLRGQRESAKYDLVQARIHPFDRYHGVDTSGLVWGESLPDAARSRDAYWATGYYGISPSVFAQGMERLGLEWTRFTFVDIGCGKGRAMLLALQYPLRRVLGVELSPGLAAVARDNLRRFAAEWRRPEVEAEVFEGDATGFKLPSGPLVLYLYHPFAAPVMRRFLANLRNALQAEPREVFLLYVNPELDGLLVRESGLSRLWDECFPMLEEDILADRFGSQYERMVAYASRQGLERMAG